MSQGGGAEPGAFSRIGYKDRAWTPPACARTNDLRPQPRLVRGQPEAPLSWILEQTLGHLPHIASIRPQTLLRTKHEPARDYILS